jgi:hypothetical protein
MQKILEHLQITNSYDVRQQGKTKYTLSEIIGIAFFTMAANTDNCVDIANFAEEHQHELKTIFTLKHGYPPTTPYTTPLQCCLLNIYNLSKNISTTC